MSELSKAIIRECMKGKADDVVVGVETSENSQVKYSNNKIITTENSKSTNVMVFVSMKKRVVLTTIKDATMSAAVKSAKDLIKFAKTLPKNNDYRGIADGPFKYRKLNTEKLDFDSVSLKGIQSVKDAIKLAGKKGAHRVAGVWEASKTKTELHSTGDVSAQDEGATFYFSMRAFTNEKSSGHSVCSATGLKELKIDSSVKEATDIAKQSRGAGTLEPGNYDVLFYPLAAANLADNAGHGTSIFAVESGMSFFAGKLGAKVASENFSMHDDATDESGIGARRFDLEGVPTQNTPLIVNGILKSFLHNTSTAKKHGTKTNAHAGLVSPEPMNLIVDGGNVNKDSLISSMKRGLVVTNLWYTRFQNSATGDFSTVPRDGAFEVTNGKLRPVKDIRVSDNLASMLMRVGQACNDSRWIIGWEVETPTKTPSLLIKDVRVTRSTG